MTVAVVGLAAGMLGPGAQAASWHLDSSFGGRGVAGLPLREEGIDFLYPPGPGAKGSLLAPAPRGSLFVGGYSDRENGTFLVACVSARGRLLTSFGRGGVSTVPAIYSLPQHPPRLLALADGRLLVVGLDRANHFVVVRLSARGQPDRSFGHNGVAQYKLPDTHGHAIIAAAAVMPGGDILAVYYQREASQPANEPAIAPGLGEGPAELVRLLPSGALDRSYAHGGFLKTTGQPPVTGGMLAAGVTIASDGAILLAYEQAIAPKGNLAEVPAVQQLNPAGVDASAFGDEGVAFLPFDPKFNGESSVIFEGLFALGGGTVEASFGGSGELFRFTALGTADPTFGTSGHSALGPGVLALAVAPDGETFALESTASLTVGATLTSGAPDPALGGLRGERLPASLPRRRPGEEQQALELLAGDASLSILVGERIVRIVR